MSEALSQFEELVGQTAREVFQDPGALDDPIDAEIEVLSFLLPYEAAGGSPEEDEVLVRAFVERGDAHAATVLEIIRCYGHERLAGTAAAGLTEMELDGVQSPLSGRIGDASLTAAWRIDGKEGETFSVTALASPPRPHEHVAVVATQGGDAGGALVDCVLLPGGKLRVEVERLLADLGNEYGGDPVAIDADAATGLLDAAVERAAELRFGVSIYEACTLAVLARTLTGDPWRYLGLEIESPEIGDFRPGNEDEAEAMISAFAREYGAAFESDERLGRSGASVAYATLRWKWERDGDLRRWTAGDVEELMLHALPEDMEEAPVVPGDVPESLHAAFVVLDERELLEGDPERVLRAAVERASAGFLEALEARVAGSPADALVRQMVGEGVDIGDGAAVSAWMAKFNARSFTERDAIVGPALERRRGRGAKRAKRHAVRQARRRNRRR